MSALVIFAPVELSRRRLSKRNNLEGLPIRTCTSYLRAPGLKLEMRIRFNTDAIEMPEIFRFRRVKRPGSCRLIEAKISLSAKLDVQEGYMNRRKSTQE
jgi:hypothetical protein